MTKYIKYWPFSLELRWKMYQYCFNTNTYFRLSLGFVLVEVIKEYIADTEMLLRMTVAIITVFIKI